MNLLDKISQEQSTSEVPEFNIGDAVKVHCLIVEGNKERVQVFAGTVIARNGSGVTESVTVRRVQYGVGVERVFPLQSPRVSKIERVSEGRVRRAKLYYLRDRVGKAARIKQKITGSKKK